MRFVPLKTPDQQASLALHRARQGFVKARTAQANQIRGLLAEFGLIIPQGFAQIAKHVPDLIEDGANGLPGSFRLLVERLLEHLKEIDRQAEEIEAQIARWHRENDLSQKLAAVPGIGPITASALVATVGDAKNFANGRQLAAWIGLVPRQHSSGGKNVLLGISKRGDTYLRTLLIHGARAVINGIERRKAQVDGWLGAMIKRRHKNIAVVALANKNARIVWALLRHDREFKADHVASRQTA